MNYDSLAVLEFAEAILHGDEEHRAWLREAAKAFIAGEPLPPLAGSGTIDRITAERDGLQMEAQACMGLLEDVPGQCLGDRLHKMVVDYIAIRKVLDDLRAFANAELRNTSCLMSNPPQSAAAWDIRNEIDRQIAALTTSSLSDAVGDRG